MAEPVTARAPVTRTQIEVIVSHDALFREQRTAWIDADRTFTITRYQKEVEP